MPQPYKRVVLKLAGESFASAGERGIAMDEVVDIATQVQQASTSCQIAVVIGGDDGSGGRWSEERVKAALQERMTAGAARKAAAAEIAKLSGWRKREIYALSLD